MNKFLKITLLAALAMVLLGAVLSLAGKAAGGRYQVLDICLDTEDGLVIGVGENAKKYVAQVVIPAREYETVEGEVVMEMGERQQEGEGRYQTVSVPVPFDMNKCTLILWKMEG